MKTKVRHLAADPVVEVRHSTARRRHWVRYTLSLLLASVLVFASSGMVFAYFQLQGNIKQGDETALIDEATRPKRVGKAPAPGDPFSNRALNIVLIGSDSRFGEANLKLGGGEDDGMRADTTILAHISKDRQRADLISFPRDLMVNVPPCTRSDGSTTGAGYMQFNSAFAEGGQNHDATSAAACTITAIEALTNVRVDGFIVVDMSGFANVIQAIGGVEMCIPQAISAPKANLYLNPGQQRLNGLQALKYARARTGQGLGGDGSDLKRIERQQKLMGAVAREILSSRVLTSPPKLYGMLNSVTKSLTMTKEYANLTDLVGLGISMKSLDQDHISFITVPNGAWSQDPNRVVPTEPKASQLFEAVRNDQPIEGTAAWRELHPQSAASPKPKSTDPSVNPNGQSGVAGTQSFGLSQATEDNPFAAKSGGADPDVCR